MATSLIPALDTSLQRQAMAYQADLLQNLGAQVRRDVTTVMTNRQMKGLAEGLQSVDTTSPQFGRQISGILAQYPLAAQSPLGQAAINQLGSEFKLNQQIRAEDARFRNQLGTLAARDYVNNSAPSGQPVTVNDLHGVATGRRPPSTSTPSQTPGTPFQEPPLPEGGLPTQGAPDLFGAGSPAPGIPAAQPQIIPGVANPNAGNTPAPVSPVDNIGAQLQRYSQELHAKNTPRAEYKLLMDAYGSALKAQQRTGSTRVESTQAGLMERGPDGAWRQAKSEDGTPLRRVSGNPENTAADNARSDANTRLREVGQADSRMKSAIGRLNKLEIGGQGPWKEGGKWYKLAPQPKGREEIPEEVAKKWLEVNHEYLQAKAQHEQASAEYQTFVGRSAATAAAAQTATSSTQPATPVKVMGVYDPTNKAYTPAQ